MRDPKGASPQVARRLGQRTGGSQGSAGNFQQNLRGERQRAAYSHQGAPCRDIQRSGELKQVFAFLIAAANENGYGDGQAGPFAAIDFTICGTLQTHPSGREITPVPHLGGQTTGVRGTIPGKKPGRLRAIDGNPTVPAAGPATIFALNSPAGTSLSPSHESLRTARFFPFVTGCLHFSLTLEKRCHTI